MKSEPGLTAIALVETFQQELEKLGVKKEDIQAVRQTVIDRKNNEKKAGALKQQFKTKETEGMKELLSHTSERGGNDNNCMLMSLSELSDLSKRKNEAKQLREVLYLVYEALAEERDDEKLNKLGSIKMDGKQIFKNDKNNNKNDKNNNKSDILEELKALKKNVVAALDNNFVLANRIESNRKEGNPQRNLDTADMVVVSTLINAPILCALFEGKNGKFDYKGVQEVTPCKVLGECFAQPAAKKKKYLINKTEPAFEHFQAFDESKLKAYLDKVDPLEIKIKNAEAELKEGKVAIENTIKKIAGGLDKDNEKKAIPVLNDYVKAVETLFEKEHPITTAVATLNVAAPALSTYQPTNKVLKPFDSTHDIESKKVRQSFDVLWVLWNQCSAEDRTKFYEALKAPGERHIDLEQSLYGEAFNTHSRYYVNASFVGVNDPYTDAEFLKLMATVLNDYLKGKSKDSILKGEYQLILNTLTKLSNPSAERISDAEFLNALGAPDTAQAIGWRLHLNARASTEHLERLIEPSSSSKPLSQIKMQTFLQDKKDNALAQDRAVRFTMKGDLSGNIMMREFNQEMEKLFSNLSQQINYGDHKYALRLTRVGLELKLLMFEIGKENASGERIPTSIYKAYEDKINEAFEKASGAPIKTTIPRPTR